MIGNTVWAFRRLIVPQWRLGLASLALGLIALVLPALQPLLSARIVDAITGGAGGPALWPPVIAMGVTFLLPALATTLGTLPRADLEEHTVRRLDELVIAAGAAMPDIAALERPAMHDRIKLVQQFASWTMRIPQFLLTTLSGWPAS